MTKLEQLLEGKTKEETIEWFKKRMVYEVGRARLLGKVEALLNEGYWPLKIAKKLDIPESRARRLVYEIQELHK